MSTSRTATLTMALGADVYLAMKFLMDTNLIINNAFFYDSTLDNPTVTSCTEVTQLITDSYSEAWY